MPLPDHRAERRLGEVGAMRSPLRPRFVLAVASLGLAGCSPNAAPYRELLEDQLAVQAEIADVLRGVRDDASMRKVKDRLQKLGRREVELHARMRALPAPSQQVRERMHEEFGARILAAHRRTNAEMARIDSLPGGPAFLDSLAEFTQRRGGQRPPSAPGAGPALSPGS